MKKTLTFLFALTVAGSSFAQYRQGDRDYSRDEAYNNSTSRNDNNRWDNDNNWERDNKFNRRYEESFSFSIRQRDEQIARINREYSYKINAVKDSRYLRNREKRNRIDELERERDQQIRIVYARFNNYRNKYNDKYYDKNYNWRRN